MIVNSVKSLIFVLLARNLCNRKACGTCVVCITHTKEKPRIALDYYAIKAFFVSPLFYALQNKTNFSECDTPMNIHWMFSFWMAMSFMLQTEPFCYYSLMSLQM